MMRAARYERWLEKGLCSTTEAWRTLRNCQHSEWITDSGLPTIDNFRCEHQHVATSVLQVHIRAIFPRPKGLSSSGYTLI
jgi:hypothetical protein